MYEATLVVSTIIVRICGLSVGVSEVFTEAPFFLTQIITVSSEIASSSSP